jgi:hypothetical protein
MSFLKELKEAVDDRDVEIALFNCLCEEINTPRSLACYLCGKYGEWLEYKELPILDCHYDGSPILERFFRKTGLRALHDFREDRLVSRMLTKSSLIDDTGKLEPEYNARKSFAECETILKSVEGKVPSFPGLQKFIDQLDDILGFPGDTTYVSQDFIDFVINKARFGPGASAGQKLILKSDKLRLTPSVGPNLYKLRKLLAGPVMDKWNSLRKPKYKVIKAVSVQTVPKTAFTDRTIASMPLLDMYFQRGLGVFFEERLRSYGCDIRDQSRNQMLTRRACEDGLATIDLSSASSWFCEENLSYLPDDLLWLLNIVRPHYYKLTDLKGEQPKVFYNWLPMGAGHTFAFMTLFFFALVRSIVPKRLWNKTGVYGDDIIVPAEFAGPVITALEALYFKVNREKSFLNGRFYESCGVEILDTVDVTPFYCRTNNTGSAAGKVAATAYKVRLANRLKHWLGPDWNFGDYFSGIWFALVTGVPTISRNPVPPSFGDAGFNVHLKDLQNAAVLRQFKRFAPKPAKVSEGWESVYTIWAWQVKPRKVDVRDRFLVLYTLSIVEDSAEVYYLRHKVVGDGDSGSSFDGLEPLIGLFSNPVLRRTFAHWPANP